ncbi:hypothetical protein Aduo_011965 [Ancylostoma duodenale]
MVIIGAPCSPPLPSAVQRLLEVPIVPHCYPLLSNAYWRCPLFPTATLCCPTPTGGAIHWRRNGTGWLQVSGTRELIAVTSLLPDDIPTTLEDRLNGYVHKFDVKTTLTAREVGLFMQDCIRKYYSTSGWVVERKGTKRPRSEVVKDADHEEVNFIQVRMKCNLN